MRRPRIMVVAALASLSLVAAACTNDEAAEPTPAMSPSPTADAPMEMEASSTITDIVAETPEFSTLLAAVQAAELDEALAGEGPFTVFAPTDDAFEALPEGTLDSLLEPANQETLAAVLTYHVVPAEVMAADVEAGEVETLNGATFTIDVDGGVTITDAQGNEANVVQADVMASNGVIHVIDTVLLPPEA